MSEEGSFVFVDVEASGFAGVPVEIGWAVLPAKFTVPDEAIRSDGFLVRPSDEWLSDPFVEWDPKAEALHGIARATLLAEGLPVSKCVEILTEAWSGRTVWCDSQGLDRAWLEVLFAEVTEGMGLPFSVRYWGRLFATYWTEHSLPVRAARKVLDAPGPRHRARLDALRLALAFAAAWQADGRNT